VWLTVLEVKNGFKNIHFWFNLVGNSTKRRASMMRFDWYQNQAQNEGEILDARMGKRKHD
jgi:hypothetical protein